MKIEEFVAQHCGEDQATRLRSINTGGNNNSKGSKYELFFAVAKICEIAANEDLLEDFEISCQELAFVDDLTVRQVSKFKKTNYQLKNSPNSAANWSEDITCRFRNQHLIDSQFHLYPNNRQVLLVSCPLKVANNQSFIPIDLNGIGFCEFFPYKTNTYEQIEETLALRENLNKVCNSKDLEKADLVFKAILAVWAGCDTKISISDILEKAKNLAKPNIFAIGKDPNQVTIPPWLLQKCNNYRGVKVKVDFGHIVVSYAGLQVALGRDASEPPKAELDNLVACSDFIGYLMSTMMIELNGKK